MARILSPRRSQRDQRASLCTRSSWTHSSWPKGRPLQSSVFSKVPFSSFSRWRASEVQLCLAKYNHKHKFQSQKEERRPNRCLLAASFLIRFSVWVGRVLNCDKEPLQTHNSGGRKSERTKRVCVCVCVSVCVCVCVCLYVCLCLRARAREKELEFL